MIVITHFTKPLNRPLEDYQEIETLPLKNRLVESIGFGTMDDEPCIVYYFEDGTYWVDFDYQ